MAIIPAKISGGGMMHRAPEVPRAATAFNVFAGGLAAQQARRDKKQSQLAQAFPALIAAGMVKPAQTGPGGRPGPNTLMMGGMPWEMQEKTPDYSQMNAFASMKKTLRELEVDSVAVKLAQPGYRELGLQMTLGNTKFDTMAVSRAIAKNALATADLFRGGKQARTEPKKMKYVDEAAMNKAIQTGELKEGDIAVVAGQEFDIK